MENINSPQKTSKNWLIRYRWVVISLTVIATIASFAFAYLKPVEYDTSISFQINRINRQLTSEYQYDGYYAIQASDLFSQTVMSWFKTPSVLLEIYNEAGVDPQIKTMEEFTSRLKTKQYSPQNIVVRFKEREKATAEKLSQAIVTIIQERSAKLYQGEDENSLFEVIGAKPVVVDKTPVLWLVTLIGFIGGFVIGIIIVYLVRYFKQEEQV